MNRETPSEPTTCQECGTTFDLAAQYYYAPKCPACMADDDPEKTQPVCHYCDGRVPQSDAVTVTETVGAAPMRREDVTAHEKCASDRQNRGR